MIKLGFAKANLIKAIDWKATTTVPQVIDDKKDFSREEKFDISDSDVEEKLAHYAKHGEDGTKRAEEIRNNQAEVTKLKDSIILDKLYDFLAENATISKVEKSWSELGAPASPSNDEDAA